MLSVISGLCFVLVVILSLPFMKSVTDSFYHSPFQKGFFYILSLGLGMMGIIYGYASNRFHRINQVVDGMSFLISRYAEYFVTLFFVVQFFSILNYTCFPEWLDVDATIVDVLFQVCCYYPVFMLFLKKKVISWIRLLICKIMNKYIVFLFVFLVACTSKQYKSDTYTLIPTENYYICNLDNDTRVPLNNLYLLEQDSL